MPRHDERSEPAWNGGDVTPQRSLSTGTTAVACAKPYMIGALNRVRCYWLIAVVFVIFLLIFKLFFYQVVSTDGVGGGEVWPWVSGDEQIQ